MKILVLFSIIATLPVLFEIKEWDIALALIILGASFGLILKIQADADQCLAWMFDRPWKILTGGVILGVAAFAGGLIFDRSWFWITGTGFIGAMAIVGTCNKTPKNI